MLNDDKNIYLKNPTLIVLLKPVYSLPGIGWVEERRDKHSHGKEELIAQEKWCDRQTERNEGGKEINPMLKT